MNGVTPTNSVSPAAPPTAGANTAASGEEAAASAGAITSDFETFLKLLTSQLQNQDPLNPMDSTEFVAQIAQFSAVEQQVRSNEALGRIETALGGGAELTAWLGTEVEAPVALSFNGDPVDLTYTANQNASGAALIVRTADGIEIAREPVTPGEASIRWDGARANGETASEGLYRFTVREVSPDGEVIETPASGFARVTEARLDGDGGVSLIFDGGDTANAADITAARRVE